MWVDLIFFPTEDPRKSAYKLKMSKNAISHEAIDVSHLLLWIFFAAIGIAMDAALHYVVNLALRGRFSSAATIWKSCSG